MKCLRCGKDFQKNDMICPFCGENNGVNKSVNELMTMVDYSENDSKWSKLDFVDKDNNSIGSNSGLSSFNMEQSTSELSGMMIAENKKIYSKKDKKGKKLKIALLFIFLILIGVGIFVAFKMNNKLNPPVYEPGTSEPGGENPPIVDPSGGNAIEDPASKVFIKVDSEFDGVDFKTDNFDTKVSSEFEVSEYYDSFLMARSDNIAFLFTMSLGNLDKFIEDREMVMTNIDAYLNFNGKSPKKNASRVFTISFSKTKYVNGAVYYLFDYGIENSNIFLAKYNDYYYAQGIVQWRNDAILNDALKELSNTLGSFKGKDSIPENTIVPEVYECNLMIKNVFIL